MKYYLAIDLGASSGRHIIGWREGGAVKTEEVFRFSNAMEKENGRLVWDVERLCDCVVEGIAAAFKRCGSIESLAIDTWGADYVLMRGDEAVKPVFAYRDSRTLSSSREVCKLIPFEEQYERTGMQFSYYNSVYQLYADKQAGRLAGVTDFLMMPEYIAYRLTGVKKKEYTIATTTGLVNVNTKEFDRDIAERLGLPLSILAPLLEGGERVGNLAPDIAKRVGGNTAVKLCLSHDTASAVYSLDSAAPYISSGTWSILGVKQDVAHTDTISLNNNFSNEGGYGKSFRYQKNIVGMWVANQVMKELNVSVEQFVNAAKSSGFRHTVSLNDDDFIAPASMVSTIQTHLQKKGVTVEGILDLAACVYHSMAATYRDTLAELEEATGRAYDEIVIVGGGAKNAYLNRLTEQYTGKRVIALPVEGSALGNLKIQMAE